MNQPVLSRFARSLQRAMRAERVLLFGSRARDQGRSDSDYDLIVVSPEFAGRSRRERPIDIYKYWYDAGGDAPVDLICLTPEEFDDAVGRISLVSEVLPEAIDLLPAVAASPGDG